MRKLFLVLLGLLALSECSEVQAGKRHRHACPRCIISNFQPVCCQQATANEIHTYADTRVCALYPAGIFNGYNIYYALKCPSQTPAGLSGNFNPMGPCPPAGSAACVGLSYKCMEGEQFYIATARAGLNPKHKHDDRLQLKNSPDVPSTMDPEFKTSDALSGGRRLVKFVVKVGNVEQTIYAKLHNLHVEHRVNTVYQQPVKFDIGQEIEAPMNGDYNPAPIPKSHVLVTGKFQARVEVGRVWYDVVTETALTTP